MTALENVRLVTPINITGIMSLSFQLGKVRLRGAPVVTRENEKGILIHPRFLQGIENLLHRIIGHRHKIRVSTLQTAFPLEPGGWKDRSVGRGQSEIQEKRLFVLRLFPDIFHRTTGKIWQHILVIKIGRSWSISPPSVLGFLLGPPGLLRRNRCRHSILDPNVRRHIKRPTMTIGILKSFFFRSVPDWLGEINLLAILGPVPAKMPLPDKCSVVTLPLQKRRHRHSPLLNEVSGIATQNTLFHPRAKRIPPGQNPVASRGANRGIGMSIRKDHPFFRHLIRSRRGDPTLRVSTPEISVAQIIGKNINNIGFGRIAEGHHGKR